MRLNNLSNEEKRRVNSGDIKFLKMLLEKEYDEVKEDLVVYPLDKLQELRGQAVVLATLIKLLP